MGTDDGASDGICDIDGDFVVNAVGDAVGDAVPRPNGAVVQSVFGKSSVMLPPLWS
jgi:hypothetical protein